MSGQHFLRLCLLAALSAATAACCSGFLAPPPGLTHTAPTPRPKPKSKFKAVTTGPAVEGKVVDVPGVPGGKAIVLQSPTPLPASTGTPTP